MKNDLTQGLHASRVGQGSALLSTNLDQNTFNRALADELRGKLEMALGDNTLAELVDEIKTNHAALNEALGKQTAAQPEVELHTRVIQLIDKLLTNAPGTDRAATTTDILTACSTTTCSWRTGLAIAAATGLVTGSYDALLKAKDEISATAEQIIQNNQPQKAADTLRNSLAKIPPHVALPEIKNSATNSELDVATGSIVKRLEQRLASRTNVQSSLSNRGLDLDALTLKQLGLEIFPARTVSSLVSAAKETAHQASKVSPLSELEHAVVFVIAARRPMPLYSPEQRDFDGSKFKTVVDKADRQQVKLVLQSLHEKTGVWGITHEEIAAFTRETFAVPESVGAAVSAHLNLRRFESNISELRRQMILLDQDSRLVAELTELDTVKGSSKQQLLNLVYKYLNKLTLDGTQTLSDGQVIVPKNDAIQQLGMAISVQRQLVADKLGSEGSQTSLRNHLKEHLFEAEYTLFEQEFSPEMLKRYLADLHEAGSLPTPQIAEQIELSILTLARREQGQMSPPVRSDQDLEKMLDAQRRNAALSQLGLSSSIHPALRPLSSRHIEEAYAAAFVNLNSWLSATATFDSNRFIREAFSAVPHIAGESIEAIEGLFKQLGALAYEASVIVPTINGREAELLSGVVAELCQHSGSVQDFTDLLDNTTRHIAQIPRPLAHRAEADEAIVAFRNVKGVRGYTETLRQQTQKLQAESKDDVSAQLSDRDRIIVRAVDELLSEHPGMQEQRATVEILALILYSGFRFQGGHHSGLQRHQVQHNVKMQNREDPFSEALKLGERLGVLGQAGRSLYKTPNSQVRDPAAKKFLNALEQAQYK